MQSKYSNIFWHEGVKVFGERMAAYRTQPRRLMLVVKAAVPRTICAWWWGRGRESSEYI